MRHIHTLAAAVLLALSGAALGEGSAITGTFNPAASDNSPTGITGTYNPAASDNGTPGSFSSTMSSPISPATAGGTSPSGSGASGPAPVVNANGELASTAPTIAPASGAAPATVVRTPDVDRAMAKVAREERLVAEGKGQSLYSITPRSGVDRSDEAPNDSPSPIFSR